MTVGESPWFPSVVLSQSVVAWVCVALNVLVLVQAVFLAFLAVVVAYSLASTLSHADTLQVAVFFGVLGLYAVLLLVVHSQGMNIALAFRQAASSHRGHFVRVEVPAWEVFTVLAMLIGVGYSVALPGSSCSLSSSIQSSLTRGLQQYETNDAWRDLFDNMHQTRGCCGVGNYTDWRQSAWTSRPSRQEEQDDKLEGVEPVSVPASCCKPCTRARCQRELRRLRDRASCATETKEALMAMLFLDGCFPAMGDALDTTVAVVRVDVHAVLVLQAVVLFLTALLHRAAWHEQKPACYQPIPTSNDDDEEAEAETEAEPRRRRRLD